MDGFCCGGGVWVYHRVARKKGTSGTVRREKKCRQTSERERRPSKKCGQQNFCGGLFGGQPGGFAAWAKLLSEGGAGRAWQPWNGALQGTGGRERGPSRGQGSARYKRCGHEIRWHRAMDFKLGRSVLKKKPKSSLHDARGPLPRPLRGRQVRASMG